MRSETYRLAVLGLLAAIAVAGPTQAEQALGSAEAHSIDGSGIKGDILFLDGGDPQSGLVVSGSATGLDPGQVYLTLVYDMGAVPGGSAACVPSGPFLDGTQMFVGFWTVEEDGSGTLFVQKTGDAYAALRQVGAVSIRQGNLALQACGRVHEQR